MSKTVVDVSVLKQAQDALELALLMLDRENQPPQIAPDEACGIVKEARDAVASATSPESITA